MGISRSPGPQVVCFDVYEADLRSGELRKQGVRIRLPEQPFQVLAILLEHPGEVVTRESLQNRLWPHGTFVDFEQGLNAAVKRLREVLDDSAETPRLIETLPRRGYRFIGSPAVKPGRIESLAVLPLENLSGDPEQEYFAEGLTEAIITSLAKIGALRVVSRTSAMQYKGARKSVREIAQELQVDAVIEGTVQRSSERVRISAQLIHASTDSHVWAENYDRDLRDVLALQAELAQAIAREIRVKLTSVDRARLTEARPVIPEAYEAYLKGRYHWNRRSSEGLGKATESFQQAIAKDPTFAAAYSGLADCKLVLGLWGMTAPDEGCGKAKTLALQALEMDRSCAEAYTSLAFATTLYDYDFPTAEREFERSLELNPRYALAHTWFGLFLALMGRYEESYTELSRAARLDPCSSTVHVCWGMLHWAARRFDEAIEHYEKAVTLEPSNALAHAFQGVAYHCKARYDLAIAPLQRAIQLSPGASSMITSLGETYAKAGRVGDAHKILQQLQDLSKQQYVTPHNMARLNLALGRNEEALSCLETGHRGRDPLVVFLKVDPRLDGLRSDPRFQDLLRRMNFSEAATDH